MKKILIIEDNDDIRENISEILELADYETLEASNGKTGVETATNELPDLIICDIMMPELDGYGVLHILSKKENTATIPFIFLTAKAERGDIRKGMILGADDYLTKPFDDTELLDAVEARFKKTELLKKDYDNGGNALNQFITDAKSINEYLEVDPDKKPRLYRKKNDIYRLGDTPRNIYYLVSGKVKTLRINEDGKELITGLYSTGDFFGYEALLKNQEYTDNAEAMENSEVATIPKEEFFQLVHGNREISKKFIQLLSNKIDDKEEKLLHLAYNSVRQRTAEALLDLYKKFNPEGKADYELAISRDDIANMVGTATESVIRVISDLKEENILSVKSGKIIVDEPDKLEQIKKWHVAR